MKRMMLRNTGVIPEVCKAWEFDGVNEYISVPDNATLDLTTTMSVSVWIKTSDSRSIIRPIVTKDLTPSDRSYYLGMSNIGIPTMYLFPLGTSSGLSVISCQISINNGVWHNVVFTYNGTSRQFYIDGVAVTTTGSSPSNIYSGNSNLNIRSNGALNSFYNGKLKKIFIFNKSLSASEVTDVYNGNLSGLTGNIISGWNPANSLDGSGGVVDDYGSNNGTFTNMDVATNVVDC